MNKNIVKCLHRVNFSQLPPGEKTKVENLGRAATMLVISVIVKQNTEFMRENLTVLYTLNWWSGCAERNAQLGLVINRTIILPPALL